MPSSRRAHLFESPSLFARHHFFAAPAVLGVFVLSAWFCALGLLAVPSSSTAAPAAPGKVGAARTPAPTEPPPASIAVEPPAPVIPATAMEGWESYSTDDGRFSLQTPPGWFVGTRGQFERKRLRYPSWIRTHEDSTQARKLVLLSVQLFREGALLAAGEAGPSLPEGMAPITLWLDTLEVGANGGWAKARSVVAEENSELTESNSVDTTISQGGERVMLIQSQRRARPTADGDVPNVRVVALIFRIGPTFYRWGGSCSEDRPGATQLLGQVLASVRAH